MDQDITQLINEAIEEFFENAEAKMVEKHTREIEYDVCPHCKKEIYERHEYTLDRGKTWRHSDCKGLIQRPKQTYDMSNWAFLMKEELPIGGEAKYSKQEPNGPMMAVNCTENLFRVYNKNLCLDLWQSERLDPEIRINLLKIAGDFYKKAKINVPAKDIYLMGSIANYNWTPDSDIDVHVMVDFNTLKLPPETASRMLKTAGSSWNEEHEIRIKGHKIELNIQDLHEEKPHVTGIYSLMQDKWIRKPVFQPTPVDKNLVQVKYTGMKNYIDGVIRKNDLEDMKAAKDYVDAFRQYGLDTQGELSVENIVYKVLRSKNIIQNLKNAIVAAYDQEMSVKEVTEKDIDQHLPSPEHTQFDDKNKLKLDQLTLDNLKACREKAARDWKYYNKNESSIEEKNNALAEFRRFNDEIKRRLKYINAPINEEELKSKQSFWLDPNGTVHPVPSSGHTEFANNYFNQQGISLKHSESIYDKMYSLGWVRVILAPYQGDTTVWFQHGKSGISQKMLKYIKDLAIENGATELRNGSTGQWIELSEGYGAGNPEDDPKIPAGKRWTVKFESDSKILKEETEPYYKKFSDDEGLASAEKYFSIGQEDDDVTANSYCWIWNKGSQSIVAKRGGTHGVNFSHEIAGNTFKGWYDPAKALVSVVFPPRELAKLEGREPTINDLPQQVYRGLCSKFGVNNDNKFVVFENKLSP